MMKKLLSVAVLGLGLAGCLHPNYSTEPFSLNTKPGEGNLVVYRDDCCGIGSGLIVKVFVGGSYMSRVDYRTYVMKSYKPGVYPVVLEGNGTLINAVIKEGSTTFIRYARNQAYLVKPEEALPSIPKLKRVNTFQ